MLASRSTSAFSFDSHIRWLTAALENPDRHLFIAEESGVPVGTVRADRIGERFELSWTIAPKMRGRGLGVRMVRLALEHFRPALAEVRSSNLASVRIAEMLGMTLVSEISGIRVYITPPSP